MTDTNVTASDNGFQLFTTQTAKLLRFLRVLPPFWGNLPDNPLNRGVPKHLNVRVAYRSIPLIVLREKNQSFLDILFLRECNLTAFHRPSQQLPRTFVKLFISNKAPDPRLVARLLQV